MDETHSSFPSQHLLHAEALGLQLPGDQRAQLYQVYNSYKAASLDIPDTGGKIAPKLPN